VLSMVTTFQVHATSQVGEESRVLLCRPRLVARRRRCSLSASKHTALVTGAGEVAPGRCFFTCVLPESRMTLPAPSAASETKKGKVVTGRVSK
jgi:hypothetical protein